ncbi:LytTR family DNA-binding domain-containing protein [Flagellimonas sp. DF-77]|uniref:LytR/AlgR family response regulator transcription factor n=1 Tax=Flagellimonas algarum TaxID=3230298 RepID=UPI00339697B1
MRPMNCVLIDDEPLAREGLAHYISKIDFLNLIGEGGNPTDLSKLGQSQPIDLIFLDIQMPILTGIEYLKSTKNRPMIIITTAYPSYALEGFELDVLDYMVKPVTFERFFKGVTKAREYFELGQQTIPTFNKADAAYFFVKCDSIYEKISFDAIEYVQAMQNYVVIHTKDRKYMPLLTMKRIEALLAPKGFLRVHKSYLVAIDKITSVEKAKLKLGSVEIPISRNYRDKLHQTVLNRSLFKK